MENPEVGVVPRLLHLVASVVAAAAAGELAAGGHGHPIHQAPAKVCGVATPLPALDGQPLLQCRGSGSPGLRRRVGGAALAAWHRVPLKVRQLPLPPPSPLSSPAFVQPFDLGTRPLYVARLAASLPAEAGDFLFIWLPGPGSERDCRGIWWCHRTW